MSDFGMFEADEVAQNQPRLAARTASRKLEAAIDTVRAEFGRFLMGATGIDEFEDRWHYSKADIRKTVEPFVHPATGTMRRIQNAMKADWKLAHPYKLAEDRDAPIQNLDETFHPSSGNLIPEGNFEGYKDGVDQGGPSKVQRDFTPGGDSGSNKSAGKHDYDVQVNKERELGDDPYVTVGPEGVYRNHGVPFNDEGDFFERIDREAARMVTDIYTDFARSNGMRVASLDTLDRYASTGIAEADYRLLESMIVRTAACDCGDEPCSCDDDDSDDEGGESESHAEPDADDEGGESDGDEDNEDEDDDSEEGDSEGGEEDFGGAAGGQQFTVPEQAPELDPQLQSEIPEDDDDGTAPVPPEVIDSLLGLPEGTIEQLLLEEVEQGAQGGDDFGGAPQGGGDDFLGGAGGDNTQPPRMARRRARRRQAAPDETESGMMSRQKREQRDAIDTKFGPAPKPNIQELHRRAQDGDVEAYKALRGLWKQRGWTASKAARRFWAAEDDQSGGGDSSGGGDAGGQAPQDLAAMGGMDPNAMAGGGMMPPPGSQAVQPPMPPQQLEDQPAEDALLDTANQAIMQMIDRETQEYQQIIDPLSQALQAIQFAQQVEQSEHPMDVTPPQGTVNVNPSAAPGGAQNPMQPTASRHHLPEGYEHGFYHSEDLPGGTWSVYREEYPGDDPDAPPIDGSQRLVRPGLSSEEEARALSDSLYRSNNDRESGGGRHEAKKAAVLKNAARLIAGRYGLSHGGEKMLIQAMGRRNYEHVREALQLLPPGHLQQPQYRAAVRHIGEMFAADNPRFNQEVWMKSVLGSASRGRLPFESARRTAGETNVPTPTMDAFEWENDKPRISDNIAVSDLPKMKGASAGQDAVSRFQRWTKWREQNGLVVPGGDGAIHDFMQKTRNPGKAKLGPDASAILHRSQGLEPDAPKATKPKVQKAVNPVLQKSKQPKAPKAAASFFFGDPVEDEGSDPSMLHCSRCGHAEPGGHDLPDGSLNLCPHCAPAAMMDYQFYGHPTDRLSDEFRQDPQSGYGDALFKELEHRAGMGDHDAARTVIDEIKARGARGNSREMDRPGEWESVVSDAIKNPGEWQGADNGLQSRNPSRPSVPRENYELPLDADPRFNKHLMSNRQASFFTRRVPGWRWDDHLNGYISKEGKAFTCSCGQKVAAPSYKTCSCGKIWNVYAIGDTHHLGSNTADMFIAREIPVRDNVIMANRKMAGIEDFGDWANEHSGDGFWRNFGGEYPEGDGPDVDPSKYIPEEGPYESIADVMKMYRKWDPDKDIDPDDPRIKGAALLFARLASSGMSYEDTMKHIDQVLAEGEGHDLHTYPGLTKDDIDYDGDEGGYQDCEHCGESYPSEDLECSDDGEDLCPDCIEESYGPVCDYCGVRGGDHRHGCPQRHGSLRRQAALFAKLAAEGMSFDDVMKHIDDVLAEGEGHSLHNYPGISKYVPDSGLVDMPRIGIDEPNRLGPRPPRRFSPTSFSGSNGAVHPDIAGYTYNGENYEPHDLIDHMISIGELSPGAAQMPVEDALHAHADYNGIDRYDEGSYDSSEHPKVIFHDQLDPEDDADWYSGFQKHCDSCGDKFPQHELSSTWDDPDRELCPDCFDEENEDDDDRRYSSLNRAEAAWKKHLADWTKYDDEEDPVVKAYGKPKPPSTKAPKIPRDWAKRNPNGTWKNTDFAPKNK